MMNPNSGQSYCLSPQAPPIDPTNRGTQQLAIVVVPDSGTGELAGTMPLVISDSQHAYEFDYTLPA